MEGRREVGRKMINRRRQEKKDRKIWKKRKNRKSDKEK